MIPGCERLRSGIHLENRRKGHTRGLDKARPPAETVAWVKQKLAQSGLQIVQDVFRLDHGRLGIPVYVCRAGRDCRIPSAKTMGKGPTPEQSEASALMEMVERFSHARYPRPQNRRYGPYGEIKEKKIALESLFWVPNRAAAVSDEHRDLFFSLPFSWVPALSLVSGKELLIPHEWFADIQGTNGLSAGNTMEETLLQGLCEVVERHVCARINVQQQAVPAIDLETVSDPDARALLERFQRHHIRLVCLDFTLDTGIPTIGAVAMDPATFPNSEIVYCAGTATHPEKALIRVLTEIQQMAVDDFRQDYYAGGILPKLRRVQEIEFLLDGKEPVPIQSLPDVSADDLLVELQNCTRALGRIGFEPLAVNLTDPLLQIPAVFVILPASELFEMTVRELNANYFIGRRLKFTGDLTGAEARFRRSMEQHPQSRLHCVFETADCMMRRGEWTEAAALFQQAGFLQPDRAMQMRIFQALQVCTQKLNAARRKTGSGI